MVGYGGLCVAVSGVDSDLQTVCGGAIGSTVGDGVKACQKVSLCHSASVTQREEAGRREVQDDEANMGEA